MGKCPLPQAVKTYAWGQIWFLVQVFFSSFPPKTKVVTVKRLKQKNTITKCYCSGKQGVIVRKLLENYALKALKMNEMNEFQSRVNFSNENSKLVEDKGILWASAPFPRR